MKEKAKQWAARLTGLSTPLFGASWTPPPAERDIANELMLRLEDRRVLYSPSEAEVPAHCIQSVLEIRRLLSDTLVKCGGDGELAEHIRAMGAACRRFMARVRPGGESDFDAMRSQGHYLSWEFLDALGQLRGIVGVHVALIAAKFDLDVRGDLVNVLPPEPNADDFAQGR